MKNKEIRWEQRFSNYKKALAKLEQGIASIQDSFFVDGKLDESLMNEGDLILKEGLIQRFEYTHELAWNVMKDFLRAKGNQNIYGSKDATRLAFANGLIEDGHIWMAMIESRNKTSHTYNEDVANAIFNNIIQDYYPAFSAFGKYMEKLKKEP